MHSHRPLNLLARAWQRTGAQAQRSPRRPRNPKHKKPHALERRRHRKKSQHFPTFSFFSNTSGRNERWVPPLQEYQRSGAILTPGEPFPYRKRKITLSCLEIPSAHFLAKRSRKSTPSMRGPSDLQ